MEQKPVEIKEIESFLEASQEYDDHPQDECGVLAVYMPNGQTGQMAYEALRRLQHRGQSGAGIAYNLEPGCLIGHKGNGPVDEAIREVSPKHSPTNYEIIDSPVVIGHTRYSTSDNDYSSQPFFGAGRRFAMAHNGHLETIKKTAENLDVKVKDPDNITDSALLNDIIDAQFQRTGDLEQAIATVTPHLEGGYCLVVTDGKKIIGVRDPWGTHPLSLAKLSDSRGYMIASEDVAFKFAGGVEVRDVQEGEIVVIDENGERSSQIDRKKNPKHCMFEYEYFARPNSIINGVKVKRARKAMGRYLAIDHPVDADVVIGVPSSGIAAADGYSQQSGIPRVEGLIKNDSEPLRSFLGRGKERADILMHKFDIDEDEIEGQRLIVVDDSLIKGNTVEIIIGMLRRAGAREVHIRLAAPQYLNPCYGGMDTRRPEELVAIGRTNAEIAKHINADSVAFNSIDRITQSINDGRMPGITRNVGEMICKACHDGEYPYEVPLDLSDINRLKVAPLVLL